MAGLDIGQRQLALEVQLRDDATLDNYLGAPAVQPLLLALQQQTTPDGEAIIFLYGPDGCGKSHLLQAACHLAGGGALYLPLAELAEYSPHDVLQSVETLDLVCLDDVDAEIGRAHV